MEVINDFEGEGYEEEKAMEGILLKGDKRTLTFQDG